jgi:hypothetical protein
VKAEALVEVERLGAVVLLAVVEEQVAQNGTGSAAPFSGRCAISL